jgi:hypothetical protein
LNDWPHIPKKLIPRLKEYVDRKRIDNTRRALDRLDDPVQAVHLLAILDGMDEMVAKIEHEQKKQEN